jgi:hypothetical protein
MSNQHKQKKRVVYQVTYRRAIPTNIQLLGPLEQPYS